MLRRVSSCVGRGLRAHVRHNQRDLSLDGLLNAGGGDGGTVGLSDSVFVCVVRARLRDEDGGRGRASLPDALLDIGEDGEAEVLLAGLLGVGASDDLCACASTSIAALVAARRPDGQTAVLFAWSRTVLDGLPCVEAAVVLAPHPSWLLLLSARAGMRCTHVPCLPVKPWNSTLVSPLMRRFLMVSAYCDEPVVYDLVAAWVSAERMGCLMACMV
jgi:hypothetical protein